MNATADVDALDFPNPAATAAKTGTPMHDDKALDPVLADTKAPGPDITAPSVVVLGDIQRDTILVTHPTLDQDAVDREACPGLAERPLIQLTRDGGAWLLHDTIRFALRGVMNCYTYPLSDGLKLDPKDRVLCPGSLVALAAVKKSAKGVSKDVVYRIKSDLGWIEEPGLKSVGASADCRPRLKALFETCVNGIALDPGSNPPCMVVIYDRAHNLRACGFRHCAADLAFDRFVKSNPHFAKGGGGVIIWNRTHPIELDPKKEELWPRLEEYLDRTVAVVKYGCLAKAGVRLNQDSSVEQLIEDCVAQERHPFLLQLRRCRHVVLIFRDGVLHWDNTELGYVDYHYCPKIVDELISPKDGLMAGNTVVMVASIARALASGNPLGAFNDVKKGGQLGTVLAAHHYRRGFAGPELYRKQAPRGPDEFQLSDNNELPYHLRQLFDSPEVENTEKAIASADPNDEKRVTKKMYLLSSLRCETSLAQAGRLSRASLYFKDRSKSAEDKIAEVVCKGLEQSTMRAVPKKLVKPWFPEGEVGCSVAEFGEHVKTTDRDEIENYMALHTLISNYLDDRKNDKPFSIATFGTPGSGKSFAIKQIVESIDEDAARAPLEFNVSQFTSVKDLAAAFHQAHDRSMQGNALVIFDEFDASFDKEPLGWLKYFLAPMQDGVFRAEGTLYHVGRAIFLFTGGTKSTFTEFYTDRKTESTFRAAKGPDFVSRLRGYMNIPRFSSDRDPDQPALFRRAIILRSIVERKLRRIIDEATGVNAFLRTRNYEHEVRSMEAIVEMSKITSGAFRKSSLPTPEQLSLHVDPKEFLGYLEPA